MGLPALIRRPPVLALALLASLVLHLLALFGEQIDLKPRPDLARLEARLIRTAPDAKVGAQPQNDKPPRPPKPKPKPKQVPETPVTELREQAPVAPPPPTPQPEPEPEKIVEAEPEPEAPPLPEAPAAVGSQWPKAGRITFALQMGEQRFQMGRSVHQWEVNADNAYRIQATTDPTGLAAIPWFKPESVYWESQGTITETGLQPQRFIERKSVKGITALGELDWQAKVITLGGLHRFELPAGTQDLLSLFYQLGYPGAGDIGVLPIVTGKRIDAYRFELLGVEDLALPFGQTWRTQHIRARYGQNEVTEVWIALEQFGLPVQIRQVDRKGVVYYLQATEVLVDQATAAKRPVAEKSDAATAPTAPAAEAAPAPTVPTVPVAEAPPPQNPPTERQN